MSPNSAEVVVIGGGINGAAILYHLARQGVRDALLIERGRIAGGPTGASSAIVRQHYANETYARMARDGLRFFQRFSELTGGDAGFRAIGYVMLVPERDISSLRETIAMNQRVGIKTSFVTPEQIRDLEPLARLDGVAGGAFEPDSGYADPAGTTHGLVNWAIREGARVWRDTRATRVLVEGGRVSGVETGRGFVRAGQVVVAAGPWTALLLKDIGPQLPTRPSRHPVATFECSDAVRPRRIVADVTNQIYLRPEGANLLIVGALAAAPIGTDADPDAFDPRPTSDEITFFAEGVVRGFPALATARSRGGWTGIYDISPDRHHIIDEIPSARGCFVVCGTSGHGFKLGPAVGAVTVDMVLGLEPRYDVSGFSLSRFSPTAPGRPPS